MIAIDSDSDPDPDYANNRLPEFFDRLLKYPEKLGWAPVENASEGSKALDVGTAVRGGKTGAVGANHQTSLQPHILV